MLTCPAAAALVFFTVASGADASPTIEALRSDIEVLEARLGAARERAASEISRAALIERLAREAARDLDHRLCFSGSPASAGYDDGFYMATEDGRFLLELSGYMQFRYVFNERQDAENDGGDDGFELRRVRLKAQGHIGNERLQYVVGGAFGRSGGQFRRSDMYIRYAFDNAWSVQVGNFRPPLLREEQLSAKRMLFAERSLVQRAYVGDRRPGVALSYDADRFRAVASIMNSDGDQLDDDNLLLSTRADWLVDGSWKSLRDMSSFRGTAPATMIGGGLLYTSDDQSDPGDSGETTVRWTADLSMQFGGSSLLFAFVGDHTDVTGRETDDQYAFVVQGGYFITERTELAAQYVWGDPGNAGAHLSTITVGANYFLNGHRNKATFDIGYAFREVSDPWANSGAGWLEDEPGEDGQIVIRAQYQVIF
jgi:phosphate-selective porin OprO/OprP